MRNARLRPPKEALRERGARRGRNYPLRSPGSRSVGMFPVGLSSADGAPGFLFWKYRLHFSMTARIASVFSFWMLQMTSVSSAGDRVCRSAAMRVA